MKLYQVNKQLEKLILQLEPDPESEETPSDEKGINEDEIIAQIHALRMQREDMLQHLARLVLNGRAEAAALKTEEARLKKRRDALEAKEARLIRILDRECGGETTDLGIATLRYRKTSRVEVTDEAKAVNWLKRHKLTDAIRIVAPTVYKTAVRKILNDGRKVPGCNMVEDRSCSLN